MLRELQKLLAPLRHRLATLVSRAVITLADDALKLQAVQAKLLAGELMDGLERFQQYGFTSVPHPGAEGIALSVGGHRAHTVLVNIDDRRHRKRNLQVGEVALYTDEGDYILLKRGRIIEVVAGAKLQATAPEVVADCDTATLNATTGVTLNTPQTTLTGNLTVQGLITGQAGMALSGGSGLAVTGGDMTADGISLKQHTHTGDSGGSTGPAQ